MSTVSLLSQPDHSFRITALCKTIYYQFFKGKIRDKDEDKQKINNVKH